MAQVEWGWTMMIFDSVGVGLIADREGSDAPPQLNLLNSARKSQTRFPDARVVTLFPRDHLTASVAT
jgi:hypothetical protein